MTFLSNAQDNPGLSSHPAASGPEAGIEIEVSIIVPTCDRPESLRRCLKHLFTQDTDYRYEVIVVNNKPEENDCGAVLGDFPQVVALQEARAGASYARNTAIYHSRGQLIVSIDDDVVVPPDWLDQLLAPFEDPETWVVTGQLLPLSLEKETERLFESYCGLGRGEERFTADGEWFKQSKEAVRGWEFGVTANAAYRAALFRDPKVGLLEETLGVGSPVGGGEDPYFFYRVLQAGYKLLYCPEARAWHEHRQTRAALTRQIYNYSKSASAYHLITLLKDRDPRAIRELMLNLPLYYSRRLLFAVLGRIDYPVDLAYTEFIGFWVGPWSLLRSYQRTRRLGRSQIPD